jgi:hypothetical protein
MTQANLTAEDKGEKQGVAADAAALPPSGLSRGASQAKPAVTNATQRFRSAMIAAAKAARQLETANYELQRAAAEMNLDAIQQERGVADALKIEREVIAEWLASDMASRHRSDAIQGIRIGAYRRRYPDILVLREGLAKARGES